MKKLSGSLKRTIFLILVINLALIPFIPAPTAHAATTTTKYLNGKIAFESDRDGDYDIYTMNNDGSGLTKLTNNTDSDYSASWSPDGSKIAFSSYRDGNYEVYVMNADGSNQVNLTNNPAYDALPSWSPDGSKLAFSTSRDRNDDSNDEVYTMNADGSNQTNLTNDPGYDSMPAWSPDGSQIAFASTRYYTTFNIFTMNPDGSNQVNLTNSQDVFFYEPSWSPSGHKILFSSNPNIFTMNPDGSNRTQLTIYNSNEEAVYEPSWSPDGTKLIFESQSDPNVDNFSDLYSSNPDGSNLVNISNMSGENEYNGSWQPLPYQATTNDNGTLTSTISSSSNYASTDYTVVAGETLVLDGTLCNVTVQSGGTLIGTGSIAPDCTLTIESGGILAPGHSPGCLASGNTTIAGTYQAELAGTTACSGYDQLQVTGTVNLTGSTLTPSLLNGFVPTAGTSFTLITNDSTDPITGTFAGLPEGSTVTIGSTLLKISYIGGTGNDVTLTAVAVPGSPNTGSYHQQPNNLTMVARLCLLFILAR